MNGIIIIPITSPAASALSDTISNPIESPNVLKIGPIVRAAKKPYTTVGMPAKISSNGFAIFLIFFGA